jgi:2,3-bisphosphoglycerate-dependent phosphoglycerate mutase
MVRTAESKFDTKSRPGNRRLTGWTDVDLSSAGRRQAKVAARLLRDDGLQFDLAFPSALRRAVATGWTILDETDSMWAPTHPDWRLNARHWGQWQGQKRKQVQGLTEGPLEEFDDAPPAVDTGDRRLPAGPACQNIPEDERPKGESWADVAVRVAKAWTEVIGPGAQDAETVLVVGHRASLSALAGIIGGAAAGQPFRFAAPAICELDEDLTCVRCRTLELPPELYSG